MAPTIRAVMEAVETRLATISGLNADAHTPDQINVPAAFVGVPPIPQYHQSMGRGKFRLDLTVTVLTSNAWSREGQLALADYASPTGTKSILQAIEGDRTLGGVVDDCIVVSFEPLGLVTVGTVEYVGGLFTLQTIATGN